MPKLSKIAKLPPEIKQELDQKLIEQHFSDYEGLRQWLWQRGLEIGLSEQSLPSRTACSMYGKKFKERCEHIALITEQAKAMSEFVKDDENAIADVLTRLLQSKLFEAVMEVEKEDLLGVDPSRLISVISSLNRSSIAIKSFQDQIRKRAEPVADEVEKAFKKYGMSDEAAAIFRVKVLGIVS